MRNPLLNVGEGRLALRSFKGDLGTDASLDLIGEKEQRADLALVPVKVGEEAVGHGVEDGHQAADGPDVKPLSLTQERSNLVRTVGIYRQRGEKDKIEDSVSWL